MTLTAIATSRPLARFLGSPKGMLIGVFAVFALLATPAVGVEPVALNLLIAVSAAAAIDIAAMCVRRDRWSLPDGAILTGVIVAFILRPQEPASTIILSVAAALATKHLFRTRWSNVFNPAAVALVFAGVILGAGESWWGALPDLGVAGALAVLATGAFIADRINKLPMVLAFLAVYFGLFTVEALTGNAGDVAGIFRSPDVHAALFFAFFMLDDPPTSPVRYDDQVVFGIIVAAVAYVLFANLDAVYYLPLALLVGNAWESARRLYQARWRTQSSMSQA